MSARKKIIIFGEHPKNDAEALKHLLEKKFTDIDFRPASTIALRGSMWDNKIQLKKILSGFLDKEENRDAYFLLYVRDLDKKENRNARQKNFDKVQKICSQNSKDIYFFLIEMELESLMLADYENCFPDWVNDKEYNKNPMLVKNPKDGILSKKKYGYKEADAIDIFKKLDFENICNRHKGFKEFVNEFSKLAEK